MRSLITDDVGMKGINDSCSVLVLGAARAVFSPHLRLTSSFLEIPTAAADGWLLRPQLVSTLRKVCNKWGRNLPIPT